MSEVPLYRAGAAGCIEVVHGVSSCLLGPVDPSFRALSGRLTFMVRSQVHSLSLCSKSWSRCARARESARDRRLLNEIMVARYPFRHPSSHIGNQLLPGRRSRSLWGGDLQPTDLSTSPANRRTIEICPHSNESQHRPGRAGALTTGSIMSLQRHCKECLAAKRDSTAERNSSSALPPAMAGKKNRNHFSYIPGV